MRISIDTLRGDENNLSLFDFNLSRITGESTGCCSYKLGIRSGLPDLLGDGDRRLAILAVLVTLLRLCLLPRRSFGLF